MDQFESFKAAQKQGWAHFAPLEAITTPCAARLVKWAGVRPGQRVLDVACGTGVVSVTAARLGARVNGLDLTPELWVRARENARIAGVEIEWLEGDVEKLPDAKLLRLRVTGIDPQSYLPVIELPAIETDDAVTAAPPVPPSPPWSVLVAL